MNDEGSVGSAYLSFILECKERPTSSDQHRILNGSPLYQSMKAICYNTDKERSEIQKEK
ncbi:MAG: hypothetical protein ACMUIP_13980 [bacterium]